MASPGFGKPESFNEALLLLPGMAPCFLQQHRCAITTALADLCFLFDTQSALSRDKKNVAREETDFPFNPLEGSGGFSLDFYLCLQNPKHFMFEEFLNVRFVSKAFEEEFLCDVRRRRRRKKKKKKKKKKRTR